MSLINKKYNCVVFHDCGQSQKKEWADLWNRSPEPNIFNSPDFFMACRKSFGCKNYAVIFCYEKGTLCGVLPLAQDRVFGVKVFSCLGRKGNFIDKNAVLVRECDNDIFWALLSQARDLGDLYLAELNGSFLRPLNLCGNDGVINRSSISCWQGISEAKSVLEFMPASQRRTLFKRIDRKEKDLEFRFFKTNLEEALKIVIDIEKGSYKRQKHKAFFEKKNAKKFIKSIISHCPENVRIGILLYKNRPAASFLGFQCGKVFTAYHVAFLKEHRSWGAGKAAIYFALEHLKKEGFVKADMLRGDSDLKRQFTGNFEDQYDFYYSKNRNVRSWWKICIFMKNMLMDSKKFFDGSFNMFAVKRNEFLAALFRSKKKYLRKFAFLKMIRGLSFESPESLNSQPKKTCKKLLVIFSSYDDIGNPYYSGGGANAVHEVAKRLSSRFHVRVLTGKYPNCLRWNHVNGVHYERIGTCIFGPKLGHLAFHCVLPFYVFFRNYDLWIESFTPPFSTSFLPLFTKKPVIGLVHMLSAENMRQKYKLPFELVENLGIKAYRNFIVLTDEIKNKIKNLNPEARIEVIPNGIEFTFRGDDYIKKHILFIGRIEVFQKGLDLLLKAFESVSAETDLDLVIAGRGVHGEEKKLLEIIGEMKNSGRVRLVGRVGGEKKKKIFREAAAVIIPSRYETFSMAALEALAYGIPIISFDIAGLKWLPECFSVKVKPFEIFSMAEAIKAVLNKNVSLLNNEKEIKNFLKGRDWRSVAVKFEKYADSIIAPNK